MKTAGLQFIRGGQIFLYSMRMMLQVMNRILMWAIVGYVVLVIALMAYFSLDALRLVGLHIWSQLLCAMGLESRVVWQKANVGGLTAYYFLHSVPVQTAVMLAKKQAVKNLIEASVFGGIVYAGVILFVSQFFVNKGAKYSKDKIIAGTHLATHPKELIKSVRTAARGLSEVKLLSDIPLPKSSECQGLFFHGTTGAGKTQAIMRLLDEIRRLGEPAIIYDKECTIKPFFFDEARDVELNPISAHCANWDLWQECINPMELGNLAAYLIPKSAQGSDPFWVDSARTILTSMTWKIRHWEERSPLNLLRLLLTTSLDEMRTYLQGTESENLVSKEIEKTAISIKSVLATYTKSLRFLEGLDVKDKPKFSIRQWVEQAGNQSGWLFITSRSKYHKEIKPLISLWLGLAMQGIQSLKPNSGKRIWLIMDELASLQRLEMLSDTVADIRKFGGCVAIGVQSIAQLEFLYGNHEAHAITDLLNTSIYFRSPKSRVAKWVSQDLGEQVIEEVRESQSYGPSPIRDGNTIGTQRTTRLTVDVGSIMTLEDLECYVRLVGNHPIAKVKNKYSHREPIAEPLIERAIDFDALEKINRAALVAQNNPAVTDEVRKIQVFEDAAFKVALDGEVGSKIVRTNSSQLIEETNAALAYEETRF